MKEELQSTKILTKVVRTNCDIQMNLNAIALHFDAKKITILKS